MKLTHLTFGLAATLAIFIFPATALSAGSSVQRTILSIGCHHDADICYANLDAAVGPAACNSDSIRWQPSRTNGKEVLSLLHGAFLAGKKVDFYVNDACFGLQPMYPTFSFATIIR